MKRREIKPTEFTGEAKHAIALAFEGSGGLKKLIAWAKTHPAVFYTQIYTKLIPTTLNANASVNVEHNDSLEKLETILLNVRRVRKEDEAAKEAATGVRMIDGVPYTRVTSDVAPQPPDVDHTDAEPQPRVAAPQPGVEPDPPARSTPRLVVDKAAATPAPAPSAGSTVPGLYAGVALEGLDHQKSSTELFYEYRGHGRPP